MIRAIFSILLTLVILLYFAWNWRSRKQPNRQQYPPQKLFEGRQLQAAQIIFDEDDPALERFVKEHPEVIDQLSPIKGHTLLMYASIIENIDAMEILLQQGADPNITIPYLWMTPLSHAVGINNYKMLKLLIRYKVNLNPSIGNSPLCKAMLLGGESTERKMIDFLIENGANINHTSYLGDNIMAAATRSDLETAQYFLELGGNPKISGTELSPMSAYIQWREQERSKRQNPNQKYGEELNNLKKILQEKYHIQFPVKEDPKAEARLRMKLYENLSERDKRSLNFEENYGENRYEKDKKILTE